MSDNQENILVKRLQSAPAAITPASLSNNFPDENYVRNELYKRKSTTGGDQNQGSRRPSVAREDDVAGITINQGDGENLLSTENIVSNLAFDAQIVTESLEHMNPFLQRRLATRTAEEIVLIMEIPAGGDSFYRSVTFRELYYEVSSSAKNKDINFNKTGAIPLYEDSQ